MITGARVAVGAGLAASLIGNAAAAEATLGGRAVAAFAPVALATAVWLLEHDRAPDGPWRAATWLGTGVLAAVAAWVSYWHLVELARHYGEHGHGTQYLLPLAPDALVLIGSAYLRRPAPALEVAQPLEHLEVVEDNPATRAIWKSALEVLEPAPTSSPRPARRAADTVTKADRVRLLAAEHPDWTQAQLAEAAGCDVRTVRRALAQPATPEPAPASTIHPDQFIDQLTTGAQP